MIVYPLTRINLFFQRIQTMLNPPNKVPPARPVQIVDCQEFAEDLCVCDDVGEPKGQCANCGAKYYEHNCLILSGDALIGALAIQTERGLDNRVNKIHS